MVAAVPGRLVRLACRVRLVVAMGAGLLCGGCPRPAPPSVVGVRVVYRGQAPAGVSEATLGERALSRLSQSGVIRVAPGARARAGVDYRLSLEARLSQERTGAAEALLRAPLSASLVHVDAPIGERPIETSVMAERTIPMGQGSGGQGGGLDESVLRAHLERAVDDVVTALAAHARVDMASGPELVALLGSSDPDVRDEAISMAGIRRESTAVPALIQLLKSEDLELRDRALGALIELRDQRAARPIADLARLNNQAEMPKIIDALGALGGDEARSYLQFVISAHDDEDLRQMARAALSRMDHPAVAGPPPARP